MVAQLVDCPRHGRLPFGFACIHVAIAVDSGEQVGFFWCDDEEMARPWAWCAACEAFHVKHNDWAKLAEVARFKLLCSACWDEAKGLLYHPQPGG